MSIVASPSPASTSIPAGPAQQARCPGCGTPSPVTETRAATCCTACRRSRVENEARRLLADVRDLANGTGVFAEVPEDERREQIRQLILSTDDGKSAVRTPQQALADLVDVLPDSSADLLADLVSRRIADRKRQPEGRTPTLVRVAIAELSDATLIELVGVTDEPVLLNAASAELADRLGGSTGGGAGAAVRPGRRRRTRCGHAVRAGREDRSGERARRSS